MVALANQQNIGKAMRHFYFLLSILWAVIALDQGTKWWVMANFSLHESKEIIAGFFHFTYIHNSGAAFGFLAKADGVWKQWFFIIVAIAALGFIFMTFKEYCTKSFIFTLGLGLIAGGAIGNLIDRVRFGVVVDFLDVFVSGHHWPAFNVADAAICVGVGLFMYGTIFKDKEEDNE